MRRACKCELCELPEWKPTREIHHPFVLEFLCVTSWRERTWTSTSWLCPRHELRGTYVVDGRFGPLKGVTAFDQDSHRTHSMGKKLIFGVFINLQSVRWPCREWGLICNRDTCRHSVAGLSCPWNKMMTGLTCECSPSSTVYNFDTVIDKSSCSVDLLHFSLRIELGNVFDIRLKHHIHNEKNYTPPHSRSGTSACESIQAWN